MSVGFGANFADVIEAVEIKERCPKTYQEFLNALEDEDVCLDQFAGEYENNQGDFSMNIIEAWETLVNDFQDVTGLTLGIYFHSVDDEGDCYDQIDGAFFYVDGMYELTKAGKEMQNIVNRKFYVTWG